MSGTGLCPVRIQQRASREIFTSRMIFIGELGLSTILTESTFRKYSGIANNPLKRLSSFDAGPKVLVYRFSRDSASLDRLQVLLSLPRFFYRLIYLYPGGGRSRRDQLPAHRVLAVPSIGA